MAARHSQVLLSSRGQALHVLEGVDAIVGNLGPIPPPVEAMLFEVRSPHLNFFLLLSFFLFLPMVIFSFSLSLCRCLLFHHLFAIPLLISWCSVYFEIVVLRHFFVEAVLSPCIMF